MVTDLIREQQDYFYYLNSLKEEFGIECKIIPVLRDLSYRIKALSTLSANGDIDDEFFERELNKIKILINKYIPIHVIYKINTDPRGMGLKLIDKNGNEKPIY
jgi:hypothetical protein